MIEFKDLNPAIQELVEIATEGFSLMEAAQFRLAVIQNLKKESLCGIITVNQVGRIIERILIEDIECLEADLTTSL